MKKIYLIDVSSMFFRAFYAIRPLHSTEGVPVNAVYGFIAMVVKLLKEKNPEYIAFCYDRKEPSFRKEMDVNYKANRTDMPEDLQVQMQYIKQVAGLFGIIDLELPGYEADDIIGTIAQLAKRANFQTVVVSGDKDFCQLVDENTVIYDTMKESVMTRDMVITRYGVPPEHFIDYLAITGDTSDNIKGIAGIGPKGAQKLIQDYTSIDGIYENLDSISSQATKAKLLAGKNDVYLARRLVTISLDAPINKSIEDFKRTELKREELRAFFQKLNFKNFEKSILEDGKVSYDAARVTSGGAGGAVGSALGAAGNAPAPFEYTAENKLEITAAFVAEMTDWDTGQVQELLKNESGFWFAHLGNVFVGIGRRLFLLPPEQKESFSFFRELRWNGYDLKSTWSALRLPPELTAASTIERDLMLMAYIVKASDTSDLEKLSKKILSREILLKKCTGLEVYQALMDIRAVVEPRFTGPVDAPGGEASRSEAEIFSTIYEKLDRPLIPILYRMERNGIKLDIPKLKNFSIQLEEELKGLEVEIFQLAGENFNIGSPKQLGVILFEKLKLEVTKKTKTGYSTDNDVLEKLAHPIGKKIIDYRELAKLKSTYVDSLPELADAEARVHTSFNQALTATGRFSSTNPNLQNIPIKTDKGKIVRQCFIAAEGKKLLSLDYSQIELRVLAHISGDAGLIQAFADDLDIHQATASEVFSVPLTEVTKEQRRVAKAVNFGIAYGQGAFGLAETLGIGRSESKDIIEKYFIKFSGIKEYIDSTIENAHKNKYVETLFGRRRYLDELSSSNMMLRKFGERAAINAPIQGTASDLVKLAMIDVSRSVPLPLLLQVHDELIFEATEDEIAAHLELIKFKMENVARLKVPLKVNYEVGFNWDESH